MIGALRRAREIAGHSPRLDQATRLSPGAGGRPYAAWVPARVSAGHRRCRACYLWTGPARIHTGPACGHAPNGIGTTLDSVWFGGENPHPAAVTGRQKAPASPMLSWAVAVAPLARLTTRGFMLPQPAGLPSWWPVRLTADTPG